MINRYNMSSLSLSSSAATSAKGSIIINNEKEQEEEQQVLNYYQEARRIALKYVSEVLRYQPQGELSSNIKQSLINEWGIAPDNIDFIDLVIRNIVLNENVDTTQKGNIGNYHFKYKETKK
jgi:hypothetical protein